jgi:hypothetical protein
MPGVVEANLIKNRSVDKRIGLFMQQHSGDMLRLATIAEEQGNAGLELAKAGDLRFLDTAKGYEQDAWRAMPQSNRKIQFDEAANTTRMLHRAYTSLSRKEPVSEEAQAFLNGQMLTTLTVERTHLGEEIKPSGQFSGMDNYLQQVEALTYRTPGDPASAARAEEAREVVTSLRAGIKKFGIDNNREIQDLMLQTRQSAASLA